MNMFEKVWVRLNAYQRLHGGTVGPERTSASVVMLFKNAATRKHFRLKILAVLLIAVLLLLSLSTLEAISQTAITESRHLHLLVPSNKKDINLSKTILSAAANDYPTPTLINWEIVYNDTGLVDGGSHLAKITGVLEWLLQQPSDYDEDLVLLVDGHDIWFQLGPRVLVERYLDINRRAEERIRKRIGGRGMRKKGIKQSIVFGSQKRCWPRNSDDPGCYAVPESTLPRLVYGPATDTEDGGIEDNPFLKYRQRYLNSGVAMGELWAMRRLFVRAKEKMERERGFGSDQNIFAGIFGEQELQREFIREQNLGFFERIRRVFGDKKKNILDPHPTHKKMDEAEGTPFEFGIGLDYESLLGHATVFAEDDSDWIRYNDTEYIAEASRKLKISPQVVGTLPEDIVRPAGLFKFAGLMDENTELDWGKVPLHTNLWTGVVPVAIHHNAHIRDLKNLREKSWHRVWFQPYARKLLDVYVRARNHPVAINRVDWKSIAWWSSVENKTMIATSNQESRYTPWVSWEYLLEGFEEEIFRDGKGRWVCPGLNK